LYQAAQSGSNLTEQDLGGRTVALKVNEVDEAYLSKFDWLPGVDRAAVGKIKV
jgi:hypothetical protein